MLSDKDREELRYAKDLLENPGLAVKITNLIGMPIEKAVDLLPEKWADAVGGATRRALEAALRVALGTLNDQRQMTSRERLHTAAVAATGVAGGAFGLAGLPVELPVSTTLMLRSIADIARSEGERIQSPEARLACLEVFAFGSRSRSDDANESAYFALRATLARSVSEGTKFIMEKGLAEQGAPAMARFLSRLGARFSITVSKKVAAQAVPVIGAAGAAAINVLFINHFQDMARGHFIVRRLERLYTPELVWEAYHRL